MNDSTSTRAYPNLTQAPTAFCSFLSHAAAATASAFTLGLSSRPLIFRPALASSVTTRLSPENHRSSASASVDACPERHLLASVSRHRATDNPILMCSPTLVAHPVFRALSRRTSRHTHTPFPGLSDSNSITS
ncbi:hypothetical protein NEOLEDRAFT_1139755 [Neolentinus lepideus HHB14362 ss-1]|uniref:Uncharacterized protein n=1 Tax=Neolentinus lepideus HHB14362 ss-1 TaxID=1314782 RepID=A0A165PJT4_9AGAM|nr:hypothetical protein NEOLEDRAFT_1139755 [Neolentinus lepideus HHB14362 ss-1]